MVILSKKPKDQHFIHLLTGTLHCPLVNAHADFCETIMMIHTTNGTNNSNNNNKIVVISKYTHPFATAQQLASTNNITNNSSSSTKDGGPWNVTNAVDIKYDYGREQFVVLLVSIVLVVLPENRKI